MNSQTSIAWHREPLVWLVILPPAAAVVAGLLTLFLALRTSDGLVVDDYYHEGLQINRLLHRDEEAVRLGLGADMALDTQSGEVSVMLRARDPDTPLPATLTLRLMHATRAGLDQLVTLRRQADGRYTGRHHVRAAEHWYAQIETSRWRLLQSIWISPPGIHPG